MRRVFVGLNLDFSPQRSEATPNAVSLLAWPAYADTFFVVVTAFEMQLNIERRADELDQTLCSAGVSASRHGKAKPLRHTKVFGRGVRGETFFQKSLSPHSILPFSSPYLLCFPLPSQLFSDEFGEVDDAELVALTHDVA